MVEAGGCSFETKARNIEDLGGQVALIVAKDYAGVYEDLENDMELVNEGVNSQMYDGTGAGIHIPTIVLSEEGGSQLYNFFDEDPSFKLVLKIDFETTAKLGGLEYELFYGSILDLP